MGDLLFAPGRRQGDLAPLRARILAALADREASPVELARELDQPPGIVAYHVRTLERLDAIALVRTRHVRGAVEHFYTATVRLELRQEPL